MRPRHVCLGVWGWIQWTVKSFWSLTPKSLISRTWEKNPVQADPRVWTWLTSAPHICSLCSGAIWCFNGHFYWESGENRCQWASMLFYSLISPGLPHHPRSGLSRTNNIFSLDTQVLWRSCKDARELAAFVILEGSSLKWLGALVNGTPCAFHIGNASGPLKSQKECLHFFFL